MYKFSGGCKYVFKFLKCFTIIYGYEGGSQLFCGLCETH